MSEVSRVSFYPFLCVLVLCVLVYGRSVVIDVQRWG